MCGIAGIWHLNGQALEKGKLETFTDSIIERGPDGSGYDYYENNTLGLGHRRLSILDLTAAGRQPMYFADRRYAITFNGEIYNFQDVRAELEGKGYTFQTRTDTEVLLAAFHAWGRECMTKFNGMWAFAIWDDETKKLFMARDRFGVKPFYYVHKPGKLFAFASETRAFKSLKEFKRSLNDKNVQLIMDEQRIVGLGHTLYQDIYQMLPGHCAELSFEDREFKQKRWFNIFNHVNKDVPKTLEEQSEKYYELFRDACKLRLISDVPVGTALSGGLDSTAVYSTVYDIIQKEQLERSSGDSSRAFVATFPGHISDERAYAEAAVAFVGGPVEYLEPKLENLGDVLIADTKKFDALSSNPITSVSGIYKGMKAAGITVSMDGHGVDEMQYGYRDMLYNLFYHYYKKRKLYMAKQLQNIIVPSYHVTEQLSSSKNIERLMSEARSPIVIGKNLIKGVLGKNKGYTKPFKDTGLAVLGEPYDFSHLSYPDQVVYAETFTDTLPVIFRDFDRAGMMNSVEIRMPFMDWRLVSYTFSLPIESKIGKGYNKLILRESMRGKMAEAIRTRKHKIGIGSPIEHWLQAHLQDWSMDILKGTENSGLRMEVERAYKEGTFNGNMAKRVWMAINVKLIS